MARGLHFLSRMSIGDGGDKPLGPLTPRQAELLRIIQNLDPSARHTIKVLCRGTEPWEIQEMIEHRQIGEVKPRKT